MTGPPEHLVWLGHEASEGERVRLSPEVSHHVIRVLRRRAGERLVLADGVGGWLDGTLVGDQGGEVEVEIVGRRASTAEPPAEVVLAFPPLRPHRTEWLLEKATELGVTVLAPVRTARARDARVRGERWERIVRGAAMQALRSRPPVIDALLSLEAFLEVLPDRWASAERIAGRPGGRPPSDPGRPGAAVLLVGPEGDLDPPEWKRVLVAGFRPVDLGPRRLRTETAAIALLAHHGARPLDREGAP